METLDLRPAELAGRWYPEGRAACDAVLAEFSTPVIDDAVAALVPHAGWTYSGRIAFEALSALARARANADLIVLFGGHLTKRDTPRIFLGGAWDSPYGPLHMESDLAEDLAMALGETDVETPEEYYDDNAVEVLVPLIKKLWPNAPALFVGVPPTAEAGAIGAEALASVERRGFRRPVFIGSTDLTHYGPNYRYNPMGRGPAGLTWVKEHNDPQIIAVMQQLDYSQTLWIAERSRNACCPGAAAATMVAARKLGSGRGVVTGYTTSYDAHPVDPQPMSFVGYVGMVYA